MKRSDFKMKTIKFRNNYHDCQINEYTMDDDQIWVEKYITHTYSPSKKDSLTVFEKWERGGITVLPPKKGKKEILEKLKDPDVSETQKRELMNMLHEGIKEK